MMKLRPELVAIRVPIDKLLFDPNNPRFLDDHAGSVSEPDFADPGVQERAIARMRRGGYKLDELEQSIRTNGWQPVDMIFVRRLGPLPDHYVVLEGNRRLMVLRKLKDDGKLEGKLAAAVDPLPVLEVKSAATLEESRAQVAYLLGVRHHGSLKRWSPFAQARNIYERYLKLGAMTDATFTWKDELAQEIARTLSLSTKMIRERLRVYRAMEQLHEVPAINRIGMEGKYYSLVREAVAPGSRQSPLKGYIVQNEATFQLDDESLRRMDKVCHFSADKRSGAPISRPDEWRSLSRILDDEDPEKRSVMINAVEVQKRHPSDVSAERQAELRQPRWDLWLEEVSSLLKRLTIGGIDASDTRATTVAKRLAEILDGLSPPPPDNGGGQEAQ